MSESGFFFFFDFFFFQAEDGIRDIGVTGVQTCALPIYTDQRKIGTDVGVTKNRTGDLRKKKQRTYQLCYTPAFYFVFIISFFGRFPIFLLLKHTTLSNVREIKKKKNEN